MKTYTLVYDNPRLVWRTWCRVGGGKERQLRRALEARLPQLMRDFYQDLVRLGIPNKL